MNVEELEERILKEEMVKGMNSKEKLVLRKSIKNVDLRTLPRSYSKVTKLEFTPQPEIMAGQDRTMTL